MDRIVFVDKTFGCQMWFGTYGGRECCRAEITAPYAEIAQYFVDNASFTWEYDSISDGQTITNSKDLSEYCVAGDIVDKRNGTYLVYMGKKNTDEIIKEKDATIASLQAEVATKEAFIAAKEVELAAVKAEPIKEL